MTAEDSPKTEEINWSPVFITEFVVISIINVTTCTIIAFARIRHLRKRSTYLIINLTVADLLVGAVTGPLSVYLKGQDCSPFLERPGNLTGPKSYFEIKFLRKVGCVLTSNEVHFVF